MSIAIRTSRLLLRELTPEDAEAFYLLNTDPEVMRYTGDAAFLSITEARYFLQNYAEYKSNGYGRWAVVIKETGDFVGWCGLKLNEEQMVDLGFRFYRKEWGKGYATEAARACLTYGFDELKLEQIIGRAAKENKASIRVLQKIGMRFWKESACKGIEDSVYFKITKLEMEA